METFRAERQSIFVSQRAAEYKLRKRNGKNCFFSIRNAVQRYSVRRLAPVRRCRQICPGRTLLRWANANANGTNVTWAPLLLALSLLINVYLL